MKPEKHKILLVDDDHFQLELIVGQLADIGWLHVIRATSGAQALARFDEHGAGLVAIITDLSMPDMDGLVLMRHLNQRGFGGGIVLLSGAQADILSSAGELGQAHGLNILGCLHKPCDRDQLQQLLESLRASEVVVVTPQDALLLSTERLQTTLAAGEFIPWYQPKVAIHSGATLGVEALARWPQADGSLIGPGVFVPAMEAAHNLAMPEQLGQIVEAAGLCPEDWVIEVTESRLMVNRAVTLESLTRLSLMGMTLKMDVVAEGVETAEQLEFLRNSGCALVQGFFVARPMPFTACTDWISLEKGRAVKPAGFLDLPRRSPCSEST